MRTANRCDWGRPNVDANGHIIIGVSCGADAFGGPPGNEGRVIALTAEGKLLWSSDGGSGIEVLGVSHQGQILVRGDTKLALRIDGPPDSGAEGNEALFMLDPSGRRQWIKRLSDRCERGLILEDESVLVITSADDQGTMLTKLDHSGRFVWSRALGSRRTSPPGTILLGTSGVSVDAMSAISGDTMLAGNVGIEGTLGGRPLQGGTQGSMLFARLDASGIPRWVRVVNTKNRINLSMGKDVFPASNDEAIGVGVFSGEIDFGDGHGTITRDDGCAILRFDKQGRTRSVEVLDDPCGLRSSVSDGKGGLYFSLLNQGKSVASPPGSPSKFVLADAEYVIRHWQP